MISLEKWMILTPLQKLTKNMGDLGKIIVAKCFECLPKLQKIAQSGHTAKDDLKIDWWLGIPIGLSQFLYREKMPKWKCQSLCSKHA